MTSRRPARRTARAKLSVTDREHEKILSEQPTGEPVDHPAERKGHAVVEPHGPDSQAPVAVSDSLVKKGGGETDRVDVARVLYAKARSLQP